MLTLSKDQIELIHSDLQRSNIYYSHLPDDLLDHICCNIEEDMQSGIDFAGSYEQIKKEIGFHGLERIQEDTLFLTDKYYNIMKMIFKFSGAIAAVSLSLASVFKLYHLEGATLLVAIGFATAIIFFLPSALITLYKETNDRNLLFQFISAFMAGMFILVGYLFKIMHWPGANIAILVAVTIALFLFFPLVFYNKSKKRPDKKRIYIVGILCAELYTLGILFKFFHWPGASILMTLSTVIFIAGFIPFYIRKTFLLDKESSGKFLFISLAVVWYFATTMLISLRQKENMDILKSEHKNIPTEIINDHENSKKITP